jgi:hypothetical protein
MLPSQQMEEENHGGSRTATSAQERLLAIHTSLQVARCSFNLAVLSGIDATSFERQIWALEDLAVEQEAKVRRRVQ